MASYKQAWMGAGVSINKINELLKDVPQLFTA